MKQVIIQKGHAVIEEVPAPQVEKGTILVRVKNSCISTGTEMSGVTASDMPLWKRALKNPDKLRKGMEMLATQGYTKTKNIIQGKLTFGFPTGYSAAGDVIEVGEGITDINKGERVACAGAQYAHHGEIIRVPRNLVVPVPNNVDYEEASTVTLGSIAMQGIRRANPTLGENIVVIGLGVLGQLTIQMLKANGCRVIGMDLDKSRIEIASKMGMDIGIHHENGTCVEQVARLTDGYGADAVIITAASQSNEVVAMAFHMCRRKGRVVLVGDVGLNICRDDIYKKELDFFVSTSYGPGRYDRKYEEEGLDYPISYVRWTENRNMAEYLRLISENRIDIKPLVNSVYVIDDVGDAYESLKDSNNSRPLMVLLSYPERKSSSITKITNPNVKVSGKDKISIAIIGAGGFAKGMHLPNLKALADLYHIQAIVSRTGHNAVATARQFEANYATTDYMDVLNDHNIDAVLITTRHDLHASMALDALKAGKHVLVEKPMALHRVEMNEITNLYRNSSELPLLLTGFNRRFSCYARKISEVIKERSNPMILNYRMNAGYIPLNEWVHSDVGGGRNIGEACHIYDLFTYLTGSQCISINATSIKPKTKYYSHSDNFLVSLSFSDGSIANLTYTSLGSKEYPKEEMDIYVDGKILKLSDYKSLKIIGSQIKGIETNQAEKGHKEELEFFARCIKEGIEWPIPLWQQIQAMEIAFKVEELIGGLTGCVV